MKIRELCLQLAYSENEEQIVALLEKEGLRSTTVDNGKNELLDNENGGNLLSIITQVTRSISPILLPMIAGLGDLDIET